MQAALLEHDPSSVAEAEELAALFRAGKIDLATMCGLDKEEVESGYLRGRALLESGLAEQAVKVLLGIAMMRPSEPRYVRLLGFAYHRLNRVRERHSIESVDTLEHHLGAALERRVQWARRRASRQH